MTEAPNALRFPPATPAEAATYFARHLAMEADPDDVHRDLQGNNTKGYVLVETRNPEAYHQARIPGAINLPYRQDLPPNLDPDLVYICYCESDQCNAATKGALKLAQQGFRVKRLAGGISGWRQAGYPIEHTTPVVSEVACHC